MLTERFKRLVNVRDVHSSKSPKYLVLFKTADLE